MKKGPGLSKTDLQVNLDSIGDAIESLDSVVQEQAKRLASLGAAFSASQAEGGSGASGPGQPELSATGEPVYIEDPGNPGTWILNPSAPDPLYWLVSNFTDQGPGDSGLVPRTALRVKLADGTNRTDGEVQILVGLLVTTPASTDGVTPEVVRVLQAIVSLSQADCDAGFVDVAAPAGILVNDTVDAIMVAAWNPIGYSETVYATGDRQYIAGFGPPLPETPVRTHLIRDQHHIKIKLRLQGEFDLEEPYTAPGCINLLESVEAWTRDNSGDGTHPDDTNADGWEQESPVGLKRVVRKIGQQTKAGTPVEDQARNVAVSIQRKHGKALWVAYRYRDRAGQVGNWGNVTPAVLDDDGKTDPGYAPPEGAYHPSSFLSWEDDKAGTAKTECSASVIVDLDGTMPKHKVIAYIQEAETGNVKASEPAIVDETDTMVTLLWRRAFKKGNTLNLVKIEVAYQGLRTLADISGVSRVAGQDAAFSAAMSPTNPSGVLPLSVSFLLSITGGAAGDKSVDLDFGDGSAHYVASGNPPANPPAHSYANAGTYLATVICTDSAGRVCQAQSVVAAGSAGVDALYGSVSSSNGIAWHRDKDGVWTPNSLSSDLTFTFYKGASQVAQCVERVTPTLDGGVYKLVCTHISTDPNITIAYNPSAGPKKAITLKATCVYSGQTARISEQVTLVDDGAKGDPGNSLRLYLTASKEEIVVPDTVAFTATVEGATGTITYVWKWKDGTADGSGAAPNHTFSTKGTFNVRCDITDAGTGMTAHAVITIWARKDKDPTVPTFGTVTSPAHDKKGTNAVECDLVAQVNCNVSDTKALVLSCKDQEGAIHEKTYEIRAADSWTTWTHSTSWATLFMKGLWQSGPRPSSRAAWRAAGCRNRWLLFQRASAPTAKDSRDSRQSFEVLRSSTNSLVMRR